MIGGATRFQDAAVRAERWVRSLIGERSGTDEQRLLRLADEGLPPRVQERLSRVDRAGARSRPLEAAAVALLDAGVDADKVAEAIGCSDPWFVSFVRCLLLGEKEEVWSTSRLKPGAPGHLGPVWSALEEQGSPSVLAVYLWKFLSGNPEAALDDALGLLDEWRAWERRRPTGESESDPEAEDLLSMPGPSGQPSEAPARELEAPDDLFDRLSRLNVNHAQGRKSPAGWYQESEQSGPQLFLRTDIPEVAEALLDELRRDGLLLEALDERPVGPEGLAVRAGRVTFDSVVAVNLAELQRRLGRRLEDLIETYAGPGSSRYRVTLVPSPGRPSPAGGGSVHPCPRCRKALRQKQGHGAFWVCTGGCGFSVQADESGTPAQPEPCDRCGGDAYATYHKHKKVVVMMCLARCKSGGRT